MSTKTCDQMSMRHTGVQVMYFTVLCVPLVYLGDSRSGAPWRC